MSLSERQEMELRLALSGRSSQSPSFHRTFLLTYGLGVVLCVVWPLILQVLLGNTIQPGLLGVTPLARDLGYTFTGLVTLCAIYVALRSRRALASLPQLEEGKRIRVMALETLLYSALFALSALFGLIYQGMGGPQAERYARTFIALSPIMFLLFVPRRSAWRRAMDPPAVES